VPHYLGFVPLGKDPLRDGWGFKHKALANITSGCDPRDSDQGPPCAFADAGTVRTRWAFGGSPTADVTLYAVSNGLISQTAAVINRAAVPIGATPLTPTVGAGVLPPLSTKLPPARLQQLGRAPFYKLDAKEAGMHFTACVPPLLH
jgi:hypothetical protein